MGRGRIILPAVDPNDIDIEDLKPGQVALFGDSTKNGNLTMKRKDGTTEDLAEKGEGGADLTEVFENADVTKIDSFSEVVEYVNSSNEENFNTVFPKWVDYSVTSTADVPITTNGISGRTYTIEFELRPQIRMGSEQVNFNRILHPVVYQKIESEVNPGYIDKIVISGTRYEDREAAGQSDLEAQKGDYALKLLDIYNTSGLNTLKEQHLNFYGMAGAIKVLNFINPDIEKDKITAELQAIVDNCDSVLTDLDTQFAELTAAEKLAAKVYATEITSLKEQIATKNEEIATKEKELNDAQSADTVDQDLVDTLLGQLATLNTELATLQSTEKNLVDQRNQERAQYEENADNIQSQIATKEKECAEAKKQLEELNEDIKSVSDTIRVKLDENDRIILPRVEYLYLTDSNGNRIKLVDPAIDRYASIAFTDPKGVDYNATPTNVGSDVNTSSIYLTSQSGVLTKTNFNAGIWVISILNNKGGLGVAQKKILSFDTK